MDGIRNYVATQFNLDKEIAESAMMHPDGNVSKSEKEDILKKVPIFASKKVEKMDSYKDNYTYRVTSILARNPILDTTKDLMKKIAFFKL